MGMWIIKRPDNWKPRQYCERCYSKPHGAGCRNCAEQPLLDAVPARETTIDDYEGTTFSKPHKLYIVDCDE